MKRLSVIFILTLILFSSSACKNNSVNKYYELTFALESYNKVVLLYQQEPAVKLNISTTLKIDSDTSSTTRIDGNAYIADSEGKGNYIASGDFTNVINTTSMPFSFYTENNILYTVFFGFTFKSTAENSEQIEKIRYVVNSFTNDFFFGVNNKIFDIDNASFSETDFGTQISFDIKETSAQSDFISTLKRLVDAQPETQVDFTKINMLCKTDKNGFPTEINISVDAATNQATATLTGTIIIEKFSGDIPVPEAVNKDDFKDYDLDEVINAIDQM